MALASEFYMTHLESGRDDIIAYQATTRISTSPTCSMVNTVL